MAENSLELLRTYNLNIVEGHSVPTICLEDSVGGDMYFAITLVSSTNDGNKPGIYCRVNDEFHAAIKIVVESNKYSTLPNPVKIGTYKKTKELFFNAHSKPLDANNSHEVVLSFYIKDIQDGTR